MSADEFQICFDTLPNMECCAHCSSSLGWLTFFYPSNLISLFLISYYVSATPPG